MNKKIKISLILLSVALIAGFLFFKLKTKPGATEDVSEISPVVGSIQSTISTTGTVLPKNRLEIKPPVNGRVEQVLVQEGQKVKDGQLLAWMSSTERAALLDAAQAQGEEKLKYWQEAYKPIALLAPIDAEVIVATTQPGRSVSTGDAVVVLSDQLIVRGQVDETDIGKVRMNQRAVVSLDAYPDDKIQAAVSHIYYESKTVNNVTIYEVDLIPEEVPVFFRSGMNASIDFIVEGKESALLLPLEAVHKDKEEAYCLLKKEGSVAPVRQQVKTGISDDKNIEILSGVEGKDKVILKSKKFSLPKSSAGSNPFVPFGRKKEAQRK